MFDLDQLVLLLSTDWFSPYWQQIGIRVDDEARTQFRDGCRHVVKQIMGDAEEYSLISFSRKRCAETSWRFHELMADCRIEHSTAVRMTELSMEGDGPFHRGWRGHITLLTEFLVSGRLSDLGLEPSVRSDLSRVLRPFTEADEINFQTVCAASTTEWDRYVRSLTPDIPTTLADHLTLGIIGEEKFDVIWAYVVRSLNEQQRKELFKWYRAASQDLGGPDIPELQ